jgi:hypothetical protein
MVQLAVIAIAFAPSLLRSPAYRSGLYLLRAPVRLVQRRHLVGAATADVQQAMKPLGLLATVAR